MSHEDWKSFCNSNGSEIQYLPNSRRSFPHRRFAVSRRESIDFAALVLLVFTPGRDCETHDSLSFAGGDDR
jgi:hypothetical protein